MSQTKDALNLLSDGRARNSRFFKDHGIQPTTVSRLIKSGKIHCPMKGVHILASSVVDETAAIIAGLSLKYVGSLACLYTAARHHDLIDDMSAPWSVAIRHKAPINSDIPLKASRWQNEDLYALGVDIVSLHGMDAAVTSPARTVADLLRPRNTVPSEVSYGAFAKFLSSGGEPEEIARISRQLGYETDLKSVVPLVRRMIEVGAISSEDEDELDFRF
jgi:hypothetical protein